MIESNLIEIVNKTVLPEIKVIEDRLKEVQETNNKLDKLIVNDIETNKYVKKIRAEHNKLIKAAKDNMKEAESRVVELVLGDLNESVNLLSTSANDASSKADKLSKEFELELANKRTAHIRQYVSMLLDGYEFTCNDSVIDIFVGRLSSKMLQPLSTSDTQVETDVQRVFSEVETHMSAFNIEFDTFLEFDLSIDKYALSLKGQVPDESDAIESKLNAKKTPRSKSYGENHKKLVGQLLENLYEAGLTDDEVKIVIKEII
jgi:hypothetical protein